ncbi:lysophospholipid acyltransferase family protein [Spirillospora sp. NPDC052269]
MSEYVYPPVIKAALGLFRALNLKIRLEGTENIPPAGGAVLVSNHISYLDFIFAGLAVHPAGRLTRFMAKKEIFDHKIGGPLMRGMHHIPVDRDAGAASFKAALTALKGGEIVGVFAEATISRSFTVKDIKSGAVRMAVAGKVPLIPVAIWGPQRMWTKGRKKRLFQRNVPVTILIGEPMYPKRGDDYDQVTKDLRARISELLEKAQREYPDIPSGDETWWQPAYLGGSAPTPEEAEALDAQEAEERRARREARAAAEREKQAAEQAAEQKQAEQAAPAEASAPKETPAVPKPADAPKDEPAPKDAPKEAAKDEAASDSKPDEAEEK